MRNRKNTGAGPEKLLAKALNLLSYRQRSEREIRERLQRLNDDPAQVDRVMDLLKQDGLVNDLEFAKWWVGQRSEWRPRGRIGLTAELLQKGIAREVIGQVLPTQEKERQLAKKLLAKRKLDRPRAQRLLLSRGFSPDIIFQIVSHNI